MDEYCLSTSVPTMYHKLNQWCDYKGRYTDDALITNMDQSQNNDKLIC